VGAPQSRPRQHGDQRPPGAGDAGSLPPRAGVLRDDAQHPRASGPAGGSRRRFQRGAALRLRDGRDRGGDRLGRASGSRAAGRRQRGLRRSHGPHRARPPDRRPRRLAREHHTHRPRGCGRGADREPRDQPRRPGSPRDDHRTPEPAGRRGLGRRAARAAAHRGRDLVPVRRAPRHRPGGHRLRDGELRQVRSGHPWRGVRPGPPLGSGSPARPGAAQRLSRSPRPLDRPGAGQHALHSRGPGSSHARAGPGRAGGRGGVRTHRALRRGRPRPPRRHGAARLRDPGSGGRALQHPHHVSPAPRRDLRRAPRRHEAARLRDLRGTRRHSGPCLPGGQHRHPHAGRHGKSRRRLRLLSRRAWGDAMSGRTARLRQLVTRPEIAFLMEAHSGLSARIVEEAGFEGIWASGLTMSAAFGLRDNNELSWSQVVDHVASMAEATSIPILVDGDTGYGNFNSMRRLVSKLERVGAAGVTIEDKLFPKTNSFLRGDLQALADIEEFCGKIKAGKDSQADPDFVLVARVEALIAGWGLAEALRRAEAYHAAGADAILIHSSQSSPAEIFAFLAEWAERSPVVLVPTKYWRTPSEDFRARRVSLVIWANHLLRSATTAMQATARRIRDEASLLNVEPEVAPLPEVFRLQGDHELEEAERRYLPAARTAPLGAVVLAAGAGDDFGGLAAAVPKAMLKVQGRPILARLLDDFASLGCRAAVVVRGHRAEAVDVAGARYVDNADWATTGEAWSLALADEHLRPGAIVAFGDIVLKRHIVHALLEEADRGITLAVDSSLAGADEPDRVIADRPDTGRFSFEGQRLRAIGDAVAPADSHGVWIGLLHLGEDGAAWMREAIDGARRDGTLARARLCDLLARIVCPQRSIRVVYSRGGWVNVNDLADLLDASEV